MKATFQGESLPEAATVPPAATCNTLSQSEVPARVGFGREGVSTEMEWLRARIGKEEPPCRVFRSAEVQCDISDGTVSLLVREAFDPDALSAFAGRTSDSESRPVTQQNVADTL